MPLDVSVDGADEVERQSRSHQGLWPGPGAEKIVEAASKSSSVWSDPGKYVKVLGEKGKLPVEVVPLALPLARARLKEFGWIRSCGPSTVSVP